MGKGSTQSGKAPEHSSSNIIDDGFFMRPSLGGSQSHTRTGGVAHEELKNHHRKKFQQDEETGPQSTNATPPDGRLSREEEE